VTPASDVQAFLERYKQRVAAAHDSAAEAERLQGEEVIKMVNLIRNALAGQHDADRPIQPSAFVEFLQVVMSGDQAVLPYQRGDAEMERLATDLLRQWENEITVTDAAPG
jgi:hypothetical protein